MIFGTQKVSAIVKIPKFTFYEPPYWTPIMSAVFKKAVNCFNLLLVNPEVDLDTRDNYRRDYGWIRSPEDVRR